MRMKSEQILEVLSGSDHAVSRAYIQERTGIASATLTRILRKMTKRGQIVRLDRGYYGLSEHADQALAMSAGNVNEKGGVIYILAQMFTHYNRALEAVERGLSEAGYMPVIKALGKPLAELTPQDLQPFRSARGMVVISALRLPGLLRDFLVENAIPAVKVGLEEYWEYDTVCINQADSFYDMTRRLMDEGARSAIIIENKWKHKILELSQNRIWGFEQAVREAGLDPVRFMVDSDFEHPRSEKLDLRKVLDAMPRPIAMVHINRKSMADTLSCLHTWGYEIGKDITCSTIFGDDECPAFDALQLELYLGVYQDHGAAGRLAVEALIRRMSGADYPASRLNIQMPVMEIEHLEIESMEHEAMMA